MIQLKLQIKLEINKLTINKYFLLYNIFFYFLFIWRLIF